LTRKRRIGILAIFMAAFIGFSQLGYAIPMTDDEAQLMFDQIMMSIPDISGPTIMLHNLSLNTAMFIPGFGAVFGAFVATQTGLAFNVANIVGGLPIEIPPALVLLVTPFGIMELVAYALAMSRSWLLVGDFRKIKNSEAPKRRPIIKQSIKSLGIEYGIVVALLLAGGYIEHWMIVNLGNMVDIMGF